MYVHVWRKYLPIFKILLKRSVTADQVFNVDRFDFEKINKASKLSCSFSMNLTKGRLNPLNPPVAGKDLVEMLKEDDTSADLIKNNHYTISMNSKFELQIRNINPVQEDTHTNASLPQGSDEK
jgi:hypothetical protein